MKSYFGITGVQSARSGLPAYRAGSGIKDASLSLHGSYDVSPHWSVFAHVSYARLMSDAANSPLVRLRGSPDQATGGVYIVRHF